MGTISGTVTSSGSAVQGATVAVVDSSTWSVVGTDTSDANGAWAVSGLAGGVERYHALVQYDDGGQFFNAESLPFLTVEWTLSPAVTPAQVAAPTPGISTGSAIPDGLIDSFEDGDISEYAEFAKNTSNTTVQQSTVKDRSNAVHLIDSGGGQASIASTSGLPNYPSQGDAVRAWVQGNTASSSPGFVRAADGTEGTRSGTAVGYVFIADMNNNRIAINEMISTSETTLTLTSVSLSADKWYEIKSEYQTDDTLRMELFDINGNSVAGPISATSNTLAGNTGVGWRARFGDSFADFARIV